MQAHIHTHNARNFDHFVFATDAAGAGEINIAAKVAALDKTAANEEGDDDKSWVILDGDKEQAEEIASDDGLGLRPSNFSRSHLHGGGARHGGQTHQIRPDW